MELLLVFHFDVACYKESISVVKIYTCFNSEFES